ncbi:MULTISPECIES: SRPBCC domain-containing protein [unclassified Coleofasciculus]|uniref:SRPBCC domain-containing protein n=1 Tax=unclassified Coleofasciculus TaxID=2692782 RepID=UPI00187F3FF6|nr:MULTISPECIES: SRPBCC domain-containing protein [unclassified Coleofasciculus]MBE9128780.1 SRPBCC domain-containing protein [Coleofasciculus sp. LEGE 07081]MBE9151514.1 SRPBCC domain-containing protein [Coleofasciculus sp. LEGE 07092]
MASLYTEIDINAPKQKVWQVLFQKERWKYWNTFLFDSDSKLPFQQGQELYLSLRRLPKDDETEFEPLVTQVLPGVCLRWVSSIPGFRNEYVFELQEIGVGRTKYVHQSNFSGVLTRLFLPFIRDDEHRGMQRMARELKRYVEQF